MRWRQVEDLYEYWNRCPPVHEMVAAYLGYKPPAESSEVRGPAVGFQELRQLIQGGRLIQAVGG